MKKTQSNYYAYLLRLWREDGRDNWHVTLQNPHNGELLKFADIEKFWAFLLDVTGSAQND